MIERGQIQADAAHVLPLIQRYLYPQREVFLRELVSNSVDALHKVAVAVRRGELADRDLGEPRIEIRVDRAAGTIVVADNGIGMTKDEVRRYINQIAVSGISDFVERYRTGEGMIGCFGIGFYSVFLVAGAVTLQTQSCQAGQRGCVWRNSGGTDFELDDCDGLERGTRVSVEVQPEHAEFLDPERVKQIVRKYCDFVPYPIYLHGEIVNTINAPWHGSPGAAPRRAYEDFYRRLFPGQNACRFWVHLQSDFPLVVRGLLYVPDAPRRSGQIRLFSNRVFVDEHFAEAAPPFLGFLQGVLDVEGLPLNLSREKTRDHQMTRKIRGLISGSMAREFADVARTRREDFTNLWTPYERYLKVAALEDDEWTRQLHPHFLFATSRGEFTTLAEYLERNRATQAGVIYYLTDPVAQRAYLEQFRLQNKEVVYLTGELDLLLLERIRSVAPDFAEFRRVEFGAETPSDLPARSAEEEAAEAAFAAFFATFCRGAAVSVSHGETVPYPVFLRRRGGDARQADFEELLRQIEDGAPAAAAEEWQVVLNARHPLVEALLRTHRHDPRDPLVTKACELLARQTAWKFGLAQAEEKTAFLTQTEEFLTWICRRHAGT